MRLIFLLLIPMGYSFLLSRAGVLGRNSHKVADMPGKTALGAVTSTRVSNVAEKLGKVSLASSPWHNGRQPPPCR